MSQVTGVNRGDRVRGAVHILSSGGSKGRGRRKYSFGSDGEPSYVLRAGPRRKRDKMPVITAVEPIVTRYGLWKAKRSQQNCVEGVGKKVSKWLFIRLLRLLSLQSEIHWDHPSSPNDFLPRDAAQ